MEIIKNCFTFSTNMVPFKKNAIHLIILHHRCGNGDIDSIHQQHRRQGWAGCGYHFYIRKDGKVYAGRSTAYVGAHCNGNNSKSLGVCLEGDFRKEKPTEEQIKSMNELVADLKKKFPTIQRVLNHKDLYATSCPVVDLKSMVHVKGVINKSGKV